MRLSLVKELLMSGSSEYSENIKSKLLPFITSRIVPFSGFTIIIILIAHLNYQELGKFTYLTAMFSIPVALMAMPLAIIGNFSVEKLDDYESGYSIFKKGLPLALTLSVLGFISSILMSQYIINASDINTSIACNIYIACVPLLIMNTYFFYFIESYLSNKIIAKVKVVSTFFSIISIIALSFSVQKLLTWHVFFVFLCLEVFLLSLYLFIVIKNTKNSSRKVDFPGVVKVSKKILHMGIPIALGLTGQKLVYFLITQRLTNIDLHLLSDLSVIMSVIGILTLPSSAFAQIHSLFISANSVREHVTLFKQGMGYLALIFVVVITLGGLCYQYLLALYGASKYLFDFTYFLSLSLLYSSSSLMMLCMSHLRALHDTLIPQFIAVVILLLGFIPSIWLSNLNNEALYKILIFQSVFTYLVALVLILRIKRLNKVEN